MALRFTSIRIVALIAVVAISVFCTQIGFAEQNSEKTRNDINLEKILLLNKSEKDDFSFVILGDSRTFPKRFEKIADLINCLNPDFVIHTGDIVTHGKVNEFEEVMPIFDKIKSPLIAVAGNHDVEKSSQPMENFENFFGESEYTYEVKGIRFILVDNSRGYLKKSQLQLIKEDLQTDKIRMLVMHAPPDGPYPKHNFEGGAKQLVDLIIDSGCEFSVYGHIHGYDYRMIGEKCHSYISGGGGAELNGYGIAQEIHHVLYFKVSDDKIKVTMVPLDEKVK